MDFKAKQIMQRKIKIEYTPEATFHHKQTNTTKNAQDMHALN